VVFRKGKTKTVKVTVGLLDEEQIQAASVRPNSEDGGTGTDIPAIGMTLRALSSEARSEFGIADDISGVLVSDVTDESAAADKGIKPGDVIVEVGQEPVSSPSEVEARVKEAEEAGRKSVLFLIQSEGDLRFVPLTISG
jgi:serine protease Do